ncbi:hypothetical protein ABW636_10720 [Aquimarina sp. 2201CG1-2-11]|uniref:hypothetical protein n=1 Tax=Aquimarina discodermiae TaxID=3231043 RepID=UPI0034635692
MKKGCLILFIILVVIITIPFLISTFFPEEPATSEKIAEVLQQEVDRIDKTKNIDVYIELLDFLQNQKKDIVDAVIDKEAIDCERFFYVHNFSEYVELPHHLATQFQKITSKNPDVNPGISICPKRNIRLRISEKTDDANYLNIVHEVRLVDTLNQKLNFSAFQAKPIRDRYEYIIGIQDVFHIIDPNNFAPN